jgi:uncharacterized protein (TIGR03437 family)
MLKSFSWRLILVVLALAICTGTVYAANACPITVTGNGSLVNGQLNMQLVYSPGSSLGLTASSPVASFGTEAFTIDTTATPPWMQVTAADANLPTTLTITADQAAMASAGVTTTQHPQFVIKIAGDDDCPVTVDVLYLPNPITMDSSSYLMRFTGVAVQKTATITVPNPVSAAFTLDPSLPVPSWLTATLTSPATSSTAGTILFDTTAGLNTLKAMPPGNIIVPLRLLVTGCASCSVNFNVLLSIGTSNSTVLTVNGTSTAAGSGSLVAASPTPISIAWTSSNSTSAAVYVSGNPNAVDFTATCSFTKTNTNLAGTACFFTQGSNSTHYTTITSLASTFPTAFNVNWDANLLDIGHGAVYGDSVTVSVLITPVVGSAITLKYQYSLSYPTAALGGVSPTSIAVPPVGSLVTAVLTGTGFVPTSAQTGGHATRVYIGTPLTLEPAGLVVNVVSSTSIIVSIPATLLQSGKVLLAVMNQPAAGTLPTAPTTSTIGITVTMNPVITAVTNAASYATPPDPTALPLVSPFEVVSIFGTNFIPGSGAGALPQGTSILVGTPDTTKYLFPTSLANVISTRSGTGVVTVTTYNLKVSFTAAGGSTAIPAFLLFATPTQINALVPSTVVSGTKYNVTVSYGLSTGNPVVSDAFVVKATTAHPGIFTADASGMGQGAIINSTATPTMNQWTSPANAGSIVSIYMTGLGAPNSTATSSTGTAGFPGSCLSPAAYSTAANLGTNVSIDGAVIQSAKLAAGKFAPCLQNTVGSNTIVTVTFACKVGGGSIAVDTTSAAAGTYAGFVADAVAGLYQVNVAVPAGLSAGDCPITVNLGNTPFTNTTPASQPGVTVAVSGS